MDEDGPQEALPWTEAGHALTASPGIVGEMRSNSDVELYLLWPVVRDGEDVALLVTTAFGSSPGWSLDAGSVSSSESLL
jgi:hypothetical protein